MLSLFNNKNRRMLKKINLTSPLPPEEDLLPEQHRPKFYLDCFIRDGAARLFGASPAMAGSITRENLAAAIDKLRASHERLRTFLLQTIDELEQQAEALVAEEAAHRNARWQADMDALEQQLNRLAAMLDKMAETSSQAAGTNEASQRLTKH